MNVEFYYMKIILKNKVFLIKWDCFHYLAFDKWGIEFDHNGDSIIYRWPWKRPLKYFNRRFISISFQGTFKSLKEIDKMWENYFHEDFECNFINQGKRVNIVGKI